MRPAGALKFIAQRRIELSICLFSGAEAGAAAVAVPAVAAGVVYREFEDCLANRSHELCDVGYSHLLLWFPFLSCKILI